MHSWIMHAPLRRGKLPKTKKRLSYAKADQTEVNLPSSVESLLRKYFNNAVVGPETSELKENEFQSAQNNTNLK